MPKKKEKSSDEYFRGEIRRLKKVIKNLESELRSHKKWEHTYEVTQDDNEVAGDSEDTMIDLKPRILCDGEDGCFKGYFQEIEIMDRVYGSCPVCERRKRLK